ncbi:YqaJ viral recombinase family protein [Nocardia sp. CA-128927]|uniref:YqaJ viral recombinase family nuclease n=1 Tax=Nocardia sp. CA-128927 TaxID=3239975 RepID=UPI003D95B573
MTFHTPPLNGTAVPIGTFKAGSPEWHAARAAGLGGSEISAVLGLNPWESYWTLWWRKKDRIPPVLENEYMVMGSLFEPVIYEHYRDNLLPAGHTMTTGTTYRHADHPWMIANPDGLIWDQAGNLVDGIEIKCAAREDKWGAEGSDQIPVYYKTQIAWYCMVMGLRGLWVRMVVGVGDWRTYRFEPTQQDRATLLAAGQEFMEALAADQEPDLDDHGATYEALRYLHPEIDGSTIEIHSDLADRWWDAQTRLAHAADQLTGVRNELALTMASSWRAMCGDQLVATRQSRKGGTPFVKTAPNPHFESITDALKG